jgi:uncharacterized membrane protein
MSWWKKQSYLERALETAFFTYLIWLTSILVPFCFFTLLTWIGCDFNVMFMSVSYGGLVCAFLLAVQLKRNDKIRAQGFKEGWENRDRRKEEYEE